jgi:tRNA(adenine34) deaminase
MSDDILVLRDADYYMRQAVQEALKAFDEGEVPIGAIIAGPTGSIIGRGANAVERLSDATAHAEVLAIGAAAQHQKSWRLNGCTLYVTIEPCMMCLGAILASRLDKVVYGAADPRLGAVDSHSCKAQAVESYRVFPVIERGVLAEECGELLKQFFKKLREREKEQ